MYRTTVLNMAHCEESLDTEILIGNDRSRIDGVNVKFTFNPWKNEYSVWRKGNVIEAGQVVEDLLDIYNNL